MSLLASSSLVVFQYHQYKLKISQAKWCCIIWVPGIQISDIYRFCHSCSLLPVLTLFFLSGTASFSPFPFLTQHRHLHFRKLSSPLRACAVLPCVFCTPTALMKLSDLSVLPDGNALSDRWVASVQVFLQGTDESTQKILGNIVTFRQAVKTEAVSKEGC